MTPWPVLIRIAALRTLKVRAPSTAAMGLGGCCVLLLAGCGAPPARYASGAGGGRFYDPKLGVYASPRLVGDGEAVPRGGGGYLTGRPYVIGGRTYYPSERPEGYTVVGTASWYGDAFHGRRTANGEIFDKNSISAAHPTLPLPSYVRVTNLNNGRSMMVRVNDRGPYHGGRVMDVSQKVAEALAFKNAGMARIRVEYVGRASLSGSDDTKLLATLRVDGGPAQLDGSAPGATEIASADGPLPFPATPADPVPPPPPPRIARSDDGRVEPADAPAPEPPVRRRRPAPAPPIRPYDVTSAPLTARPSPAERAGLERLIGGVPPTVGDGRGPAGAQRLALARRRTVARSDRDEADDVAAR